MGAVHRKMRDGDLCGERLRVWSVSWDLGNEAGDVDLPPVKNAAKPAVLILCEHERAATVRAALGEKPDTAVRRAEGNVISAEKADSQRGTVGYQLGGQDRWYPVVPHQAPHWGVTLYPG
jgi:hypothetical protein